MSAVHSPEAVGQAYSLAKMVHARDKTFEAVRRIAAKIVPGVTEGAANDIANAELAAMGAERLWHRNVIRFGAGTLETFHGEFQPDYALAANDIFFVDLGVVWDGHEGDAGQTFVVGDDADMLACAKTAEALWHEVANRWKGGAGLTGQALYDFARDRAEALGWRLNWEVKGHRVSDFPHAIYKAGDLGDLDTPPTTGLWILEIQIAHPTRPIGAFYEDLLVGDVAA